MRMVLFLLMSAVTTTACAVDLIDANKLQTPSEPTCIDLKQSVIVDSYQTIFKWHWAYKLVAGPYIAEKVDAHGTYYRAPPGGLSERGPHSPAGSFANTYDGGFYVPNDARAIVGVYEYRSVGRVPVQLPPRGADCSTSGYVKDPATSKISLVAFGFGGAIGGATGAVIARSTVAHGKLGYGQTAGAGAAGGLIGGMLVGAIVNHEMGKIVFIPGIRDEESLQKLKSLAAGRVPLKQVQTAGPPADSRAPVATTR